MKPARVFLAIVAALCVLPLSSCGRLATPPDTIRSVVMVEVEIAPGIGGHGSGFALRAGDTPAATVRIYTCAHVVHGAKKITVIFSNGKKQSAKLLREDKDADLAELEIAEPEDRSRHGCLYRGLQGLTLRKSPPHFFEKVWEIGNPSDMRFVTTTGYFLTFNGKENIFLIDSWFGNSGSPIMDSSGQVIGMTHDIIPGTRFTGCGTLQELQNFVNPDRPR